MKTTKLPVLFAAAGVLATMGFATNVSADEIKDTKSETAIVEKAKAVIKGVDEDGTNIPTGEERVAYLESQDFEYQAVQDKVNELLNHVVTEQPVQPAVQEAPAAETYVEETSYQPEQVQQAQPQQQEQSYTGTSSSAKEWIAMKESTNNYNATNGRYIGKYQLDSSYLNGDYSPANQERVADEYVAGRYGSWENAQAFWMQNGWY